MPRHIVAPLEDGTQGGVDGESESGVINMAITLYEPGEPVHPRAVPLRDLIATHLDPDGEHLVIGGNGQVRLSMPVNLLADVPGETPATVGIRWIPNSALGRASTPDGLGQAATDPE